MHIFIHCFFGGHSGVCLSFGTATVLDKMYSLDGALLGFCYIRCCDNILYIDVAVFLYIDICNV